MFDGISSNVLDWCHFCFETRALSVARTDSRQVIYCGGFIFIFILIIFM